MADYAELFQADESKGNLLVLFIPSADREGNSLGRKEQKRWVRKAMKLLGRKLGGATAYPRGWGVWRDDARDDRLVWDRPILIQCFTNEDELEKQSGPLREFLIQLGSKTNQGAVAFTIDQSFYEIRFPIQGG